MAVESILPKTVFIVGAPGAGKSVLVRQILSWLPMYHSVNDLDQLQQLMQTESKSPCPSIVPLESGGFDIVKPAIWDYALSLTARAISSEEHCILEFSRGVDERYLEYACLRKHQVYEHSFDVVLAELPHVMNSQVLVIHVSAGYGVRSLRNLERRRQHQHSVADQVMCRIYREDNFSFVPTTAGNLGYLSDRRRIPVYSIDNHRQLPPVEMEMHLRSEAWSAFMFYQYRQSINHDIYL